MKLGEYRDEIFKEIRSKLKKDIFSSKKTLNEDDIDEVELKFLMAENLSKSIKK